MSSSFENRHQQNHRQQNRRRISVVALLACSVAIAGCVPSLNAIYTEDDVAFDEALIGTWMPQENNESWEFSKQGDNAYRLVYTDKEGKYGVFDATLVKLGDARFLDLTPVEEPELARNALWKWHLTPTHTWLLVEGISSTLQLRAMSPNWAKEYLQNHPHELDHIVQNDRVIITAGTRDIQQFATLHINTHGAYGEVYSLYKDE